MEPSTPISETIAFQEESLAHVEVVIHVGETEVLDKSVAP